MSPFTIRCCKPGSEQLEHAVFILSKGRNTGRPSFIPNPNCFVLTCEDPSDRENYYWLIYALWAGGRFHEFLCGSVIEFIHIRDLKKLISLSVSEVKDIQKVSTTLQQVIQMELHLQNQLSLISQAKRAVLQKWI
ncbi:MAG: hypothetical protein ABI581_08550 [Sediminibacterium sp.]